MVWAVFEQAPNDLRDASRLSLLNFCISSKVFIIVLSRRSARVPPSRYRPVRPKQEIYCTAQNVKGGACIATSAVCEALCLTLWQLPSPSVVDYGSAPAPERRR